MPFQPMLASNIAPRQVTGRWVLEPKFDGWRVIVSVDATVRVWTRRGHDLTERLPELAALADVVDARVVLDGELVAGSTVTFSDRGDHALKGVPGTWQLFGVTDA